MIYGESMFQNQIIQFLRFNKIFCFSVPNGTKLKITQAKKAKREGMTSGVSDLIILLPQRAIFVEIKNPNGKGRQSSAQKEFEEAVKELGFEYYIWEKWEQVEEFVREVRK